MGTNQTEHQNWTEEEEQIIRRSIGRVGSIKEIAALLPHRSFTCVKQRIYVLGLQVVGHRQWEEVEDAIIRENYPFKTAREMVELLPGRNLNAIKARANLLKIVKKVPYLKNESFFETPNLINCAVAGFIAADGNINEKKQRLTINISQKDLKFLENISKLTGFNGKIRLVKSYRKEWISLNGKRTIPEGTREMCVFSVSCEKWCSNLAKNWNITPAKTYTLMPPNLTDNKLKMAFISGQICGDGWVFKSKGKDGITDYGLGIMGTTEQMQWILDTFQGLLSNSEPKKLMENGSPNNREFNMVGANFYWLSKLFLSLDIPRLDRKWDIAREFINLIETGQVSQNMLTSVWKRRPSDEILLEFGLVNEMGRAA